MIYGIVTFSVLTTFLIQLMDTFPLPGKNFIHTVTLTDNIFLDPTPILHQSVTTFNYGGYTQIRSTEEISIPSERKADIPLKDTETMIDNMAHETDPFSIPETSSEDFNLSNNLRKVSPGFINQIDPKVQEVDVVGWFE